MDYVTPWGPLILRFFVKGRAELGSVDRVGWLVAVALGLRVAPSSPPVAGRP